MFAAWRRTLEAKEEPLGMFAAWRRTLEAKEECLLP